MSEIVPTIKSQNGGIVIEAYDFQKKKEKQNRRPLTTARLTSSSNGELGLTSVRHPSWNQIRIREITIFFPQLVQFLHTRLNYSHKVAEIVVDEVGSPAVL